MKTIIDFSKCSNEDVAELLFATFEPCGWLCSREEHREHGVCYREPYTSTCPASIIGREDGYVLCEIHYDDRITNPEIARQCWDELDRRACETPRLRRKG